MKLKRETYLEQIRPYYDSDIIRLSQVFEDADNPFC